MNKTITKIERYIHTEPGYRKYWIDIVRTTIPRGYEAWITRKTEGTSSLMFWIPEKQPNGEELTYEGFIELVEGNLEACGAESFMGEEI